MNHVKRGSFFVSLYSVVALFLSGLPCSCSHPDKGLEQLYQRLDAEIANIPAYEEEKNRAIDILKKELASVPTSELKIPVVNLIIDQYDAYISDSALHYIDENLALYNSLPGDHSREIQRLEIRKADVTSHAGLFTLAQHILDCIDSNKLDPELKEKYFEAYCNLLQYLVEYSTNSEVNQSYVDKREIYIDSVIAVSSPESFTYAVYKAPKLVNSGQFDQARELLDKALSNYSEGDRQFSILQSILAYNYARQGDLDNQKRTLALSAISDAKGAIKENMSFRALAALMYDDGDIERANRYLKTSFSDANFYSARMRNSQSGAILPIIDQAFEKETTRYNQRLRALVIAVSVMAVLLLISLVVIIKEVKNVRRHNARLSSYSENLQLINQQLHAAQQSLSTTNSELQESNLIKEEYITLLMQYCSLAIKTMQKHLLTLRKSVAKGDRELALRKLDSNEAIDSMLKDFYLRFDEAFLGIYPDFVEKLNSLLKPDEQFAVNREEHLNTEMRVFALMRLGITDNNKIAEFLRCSLTTIYTYRSKVKRRALDPDTFETQISAL